MIKKSLFYIWTIGLLVFLGCSDSEDGETTIIGGGPGVITKEALLLENGGVQLYADFSNFSSSDELGFNVFAGGRLLCSLDVSNPQNGSNAVILTSGLYPGVTYEYQGFITTQTETIYGLMESFVSQGSKPIKITGINLEEGHFNDEVELTLDTSDFKINSAVDFKVLFNGTPASNVYVDGDKVTLKIPYFEGAPIASIKLEYFGSLLETSYTFQLYAPVVDEIMPEEVGIGGEITIKGDHFENFNRNYLKVFFDEHEAEVLSFSRTELKVQMPLEVSKPNPEIKVLSHLQEAVTDNLFTVKSPVINSYPEQDLIFNEIELIGENFHPEYYKNQVYFGDVLAHVQGGDSQRLVVRVPSGPYTSWDNPITIKISEEIQSAAYPFELNDLSIEIMDDAAVYIDGFQEFNDNIYVFGFDIYAGDKLIVQKYSEAENRFYDERVISMPVADSRTIINVGNGFVYVLYNRDQRNFFKVNIETGDIFELANVPGEKTFPRTIGISGDDIIAGGILQTDYYDKMDVFKYSMTNDTWTQIDDFTDPPTYRNFYSTKDNESYFLQGYYSSLNDVYKFDGSQYQLTTIDLPDGDFTEMIVTNSYFFKYDKFYFVEDADRIEPNRMMTFDTTTFAWLEIPRILPQDYPVTGIFNKGDNLYIQIIDYQYKYHLFKLDLSRID